MDNKEEKAKKFAEKQKEIAKRGAEIIKDNLKKSDIELNDEQFKMINGVIASYCDVNDGSNDSPYV